MLGKIIAPLAAAILIGSTALASAQQQAVPQDRYWGYNDGYYGLGPPPEALQFGMAPYASYPGYYNSAYYPGYYNYAPGYDNYAPGYDPGSYAGGSYDNR
jgi:hypothetical protein